MPVDLKRPAAPATTGGSDPAVAATVAAIVADVRERGDAAVRDYSARFDRWEPTDFRLDEQQITACMEQVDEQALEDLRWCQQQVRTFARAQRESLLDIEVETLPGVRLGHRNVPVGRVGAYIPGGRYPMIASAAMSIVTAKAAGVEHVIACTPPLDGAPPALTVAAMQLAGADEIRILGGVQAIAAMAVGTETIARVDVLAGPGNAYVAEAKRQLFGEVGIDLFAGPTEILVIADGSADPEIVAADLLGQAEHGPTSPAVLISTSERVARETLEEVERQLATLPTADVAGPAWRDHGAVHVVATPEEAAALADDYAYEHVEILTAEPRWFLDRLRNYGALFLGEGTTVAYGDKAIGTNHVLPTAGAARYTGGLWVGKYLKTVTYQECDPAASARIGEICARQCRLEHFEGHARSCDVRVRKYADALTGAR
ncbi:histidinol dehydrogenase [Conexibacter stalactiti]|uniref:Histidinol dehydrogenase n=1 Tax=Conexibacter stalactiti TaxID=1940611 RepID=A0ABU4HHX4_9ACTN|nr:histidinol dehydrogenase [Conexibacter stalactiti]MDW5592906.1 histidinol dehydrogenase [Conexibacter stalactiti]MEC5033547.1 histidinol dehydrogenase [Conexibacter stalactiti]